MNGLALDQAISLSIRQAAAATGMARTRLYAAIANGQLKTFKAGRRRMVRVEQLKRYVERLEREHAVATGGAPA